MDFITSDLHYGDRGAIKYNNRPFADVDEMDKYLIEYHNDTLTDSDTLYIVGDIAYRNRVHINNYLDQLRGKKVIVYGNHDYRNRRDINNHHSVIKATDYLSTNRLGHRVVIMHFPILDWDGMYHGSVMLHGHCHGTMHQPNKRTIDIGWDAHNRYLMLDEAVQMAIDKASIEEVRSNLRVR